MLWVGANVFSDVFIFRSNHFTIWNPYQKLIEKKQVNRRFQNSWNYWNLHRGKKNWWYLILMFLHDSILPDLRISKLQWERSLTRKLSNTWYVFLSSYDRGWEGAACPRSIAVEPDLSSRSSLGPLSNFIPYRNGADWLYSWRWWSKNDPVRFISVGENIETFCCSKPKEMSPFC